MERETVFRDLDWEITRLGAADLDSDGDQDLVSSDEERGAPERSRLLWHENVGGGDSFVSHIVFDTPENSPIVFTVADVDSDGDLDIVASATSTELMWFENDGAADPSWGRHVITADFSPSDVGVKDLDRDGDLDLIGFGDGDLRLYENVDGEFDQLLERVIAEVPSVSRFVAGDLNRDGWQDVLTTSSGPLPNITRWFENRGDWVFEEHLAAYTAGLAPSDAEAADLDGDGQLDLFGVEATSSSEVVRVEARTSVGGWSVGLEGVRARCRNLSTGQTVVGTGLGNEVDCESLGLTVSPGDRVSVFVGGRVAL